MNTPSIGPIDSTNILSYQNGKAAVTLLSIDDAIERLGYGRFQVRVMIAAGLCFAADAMEVLLLTFLAVVLQAEWDLSSQETAFLTGTVFIGATFGTLILGPLGDQVGRRPIFILAALLISVFGVATAFCDDLFSLCLTRMVVGFGIGGLTVPFDILAEVLPTNQRSKNLLYIEYFWTAGTLLVPLFAYLAIGNGGDADGWRYFCVLCAIPCIVSAMLGTWLVPESPRWLVTVGQEERALEILRQAATTNGLDANKVFPEGTWLQREDHPDATMCDLFSPSWRRITIRLWITWGGTMFLYYGTILAITLVFANDNANDKNTLFEFDYQAIFVSCSAEFFGTAFCILLVDRVGRIPMQVISLLLGVISVMAMIFFAADGNNRSLLVGLAFFARWFMMSLTCTLWISTAEILTTEIRTTGHSAANAVARIGGFLAPFCVAQASTPTLAMTMAGVAIFAGVALSGLPETTGKSMGVREK